MTSYYMNNGYTNGGTEKKDLSGVNGFPVYVDKTPLEDAPKTSNRHVILITAIACCVTAGIVCAIAIPLINNDNDCDCHDDMPCATPEPTMTPTTKPTPPPTGPLRQPLANTVYGPVMGHEVDMGTGSSYGNVMSYLGVRYAARPDRWVRATPPVPFTQPYEASTLQSVCIQNVAILHFTQPYWQETSEDCLYINIYSPMDNSTLYPVMLWFHGGGFQNGGNIQYPGQTLAPKGVVVAVANYRLNIFGFASTADGELPGNLGLWDQRQAMLYVQQTISAYGGDPTRVTIAGESAGAAATGLHLVSPQTKGLFHQAIAESGNYNNLWAMNLPIDRPGTYMPQVAAQVGCPTANTTDMINCMKTVNASILQQNSDNFNCPFCLGFEPVVDGEGGYLPKPPRDIVREGGLNNVNLLTGVNSGECSLGILGFAPWAVPQGDGFNRTTFQKLISEVVEYFYYVVTETDVTPEQFYMLLNWYYTPWPDIHNLTANKLQLSRLCTDAAFVAPNAETVKFQAQNNTVYMYVNGIMPVPYFPPIPPWLKASVPHMFELPYVWGYPEVYFGTESLQVDTGNLTVPFICWSPDDLIGQKYFQTLWTNFIIYGNPTPTPVETGISGQPPVTWDMYDNTNYSYLLMGNEINEMQRNYRLQAVTLATDYVYWMARGQWMDDVDPYKMGPLTRTEYLDPTVAEALGISMAPPAGRKKRSLPEEVTGHRPLNLDTMDMEAARANLILDSIKEFLHNHIDQINTTLVQKTNLTISELTTIVTERWPVVKDSRCYNSVMPYAKYVVKNHKEEIMAKIMEYLQSMGFTTPRIPHLPG